MQIVIDIDEHIIEHLKDGSFGARPYDKNDLIDAVMNATPLSEVLDSIKGEINDYDEYMTDKNGLLVYAITTDRVFDILDKYRKEQE